jgi:exodeoxyribonuclease-1
VSFVFFDTETTGLKFGFDQIVQFAAVRTDTNLNEIDRFEIRSRLLPHVIPHPQALATNGLSIESLIDPRRPSHYEMITEVRRKLLSWSPAIFLGYNSIRFDEEMLRHAFFQNLYPPYLTSRPGNGRGDVWGLLMAAVAATPSCLTVPTNPNGKAVFKLERIAVANGITDKAHDALGDVLATLKLCRLAFERSPELWQRFVRFSNKAAVRDFVDSEDGFILTEFYANEAFHAPVVTIGEDPGQPNGRLCLSLLVDASELLSLSDDLLADAMRRKPCPVRRFRVNAAPTLTALYEATNEMLGGVTLEDLEERARTLRGNPDACRRISAAYLGIREPWMVAPHLESRLYDGFPDQDDEVLMGRFHEMECGGRLAVVNRLKDERLRYFGRRLMYFESRSTLPEELRNQLDIDLCRRLFDATDGGLTVEEALSETRRMLAESEANRAEVLPGYQSYLMERASRVAAFRSARFL